MRAVTDHPEVPVYSTSRETTIASTPQKIFELIADLERHSEWSGSGEVRNVRKITEGPVRVGTRFEADENITQPAALKIKFIAQSHVTAFEQDHLFRWKSPVPKPPEGYAEWTYELTPEGDTTKVTESVNVYFSWRWFELLAGLLVGGLYRKYRSPYIIAGMDETLTRLKARAEAP
jgi:uncharacterized protein YndB with AHSA1/START domain